MKRVILFVLICFGLSTFSLAQSGIKPAKKQEIKIKSKPANAATSRQVVPMPKQETKISAAKNSRPAQTDAVVLKKDGTPDKRYKNKDVSNGPLKKDGTPDKRFKSNRKNR